EIYDLDADAEELTNLAAKSEHAELLKKLRAEAIGELRKTDAKFVDKLPKTKQEMGDGARADSEGLKLPTFAHMNAMSHPEAHDNAEFEGQREKADPEYYGFKAEKRSQISPGDEIVLKPLDGRFPTLKLRCLGARQKFIDVKGETNECCAANSERPVDNTDNA